MSSYRVRFNGSEIHAETVSRHDTADEATEAALDAARTASYGGVYYTVEEREDGGAWRVLARYTRERADREDADEDADEEADEEADEPPVGSFEGERLDDIIVREVHLHGGKATAIIEPGYACDDDGPLVGPIVDARAYVRRCLPAGWDMDEEISFSPVYQDGSGQSRERWTFTLVRKGA